MTVPPEFALRCPSCGRAPEAPDPAAASWAVLAGHGDAKGVFLWHATEASARDGAVGRETLAATPAIGETHWASLDFPVAVRLDTPLWVLHETPATLAMGFEDGHPETDLPNFVRCRPALIEAIDPSRAVARVVVEAVTTFEDLRRLPPSPHLAADDLWADHAAAATRRHVRLGDLIVVSSSWEGDIGSWAILEDRAETTDLLVLARWGWHHDHLWAGRTRLRAGTTMIGPGLDPAWRERR